VAPVLRGHSLETPQLGREVYSQEAWKKCEDGRTSSRNRRGSVFYW